MLWSVEPEAEERRDDVMVDEVVTVLVLRRSTGTGVLLWGGCLFRGTGGDLGVCHGERATLRSGRDVAVVMSGDAVVRRRGKVTDNQR